MGAALPGKSDRFASRSGNSPDAVGPQEGRSPVRNSCTMTSAMFAQLSNASPMLLMPAARKWKNGAMSGVHMSRSNLSPALRAHRTVVARGITTTSCVTAFTTLCTASARFRSRNGYRMRSTGAASVPQKFWPSWVPSATNSLTFPMLDSRSITPFSGWRHCTPSQKKDSTNQNRAMLRFLTRSTSAVAIFRTVAISLMTSGSSPCSPTALINQIIVSQRGISPRSRTSTTFRGITTVYCIHGPTLRL